MRRTKLVPIGIKLVFLAAMLPACGTGSVPYEIPAVVQGYIVDYGFPVRGYGPAYLLTSTQFMMNDLSHTAQVTGPSEVTVDYSFLYLPPTRQARMVFHELVHRAQIEDLGYVGFCIEYAAQAVHAGTYGNMKHGGLEGEAYWLAQIYRNILEASIR